jgi:hypothetical protein
MQNEGFNEFVEFARLLLLPWLGGDKTEAWTSLGQPPPTWSVSDARRLCMVLWVEISAIGDMTSLIPAGPGLDKTPLRVGPGVGEIRLPLLNTKSSLDLRESFSSIELCVSKDVRADLERLKEKR